MKAYQLSWNVIRVLRVDHLVIFLQGTNTYPTFGNGKSSTQKCPLGADMLVSQEGKY